MEPLFILVALQGLLGAFDTFYHHEFAERLTWRPAACRELRIHALRNLFYGVIFLSLGWIAWQGLLAWLFAAILVLEIGLTLWDFVIEDRTRDLPASERVTHTLLALNYGAILVMLLPVIAGWATRPSGAAFVDHGLWSWLMTFFAMGVTMWALRDFSRARWLAARDDSPPARLTAALPARISVLVTGGTGFIGRRLCQVLIAGGHRVSVLTRDKRKARLFRGEVTLIDGLEDLSDQARFDVIVNLAGEPVAEGRWTPARRRKILESRVATTEAVVDFVARAHHKPSVLLNASAVGFYGTDSDAVFDEDSDPNPGFTHEVCRVWERTALKARKYDLRVCLLRFGIVLGGEGGALARMLLPFEFGLGGPMGAGRHGGRQWMSWIHLDDAVGLLLHAMADVELCGPVNVTAPQPVRNRDFAQALGRALRRPVFLSVPAAALRLAFGRMADEVLLSGQKVLPTRAEASGYQYLYPELDQALAEIVGGRTPAETAVASSSPTSNRSAA